MPVAFALESCHVPAFVSTPFDSVAHGVGSVIDASNVPESAAFGPGAAPVRIWSTPPSKMLNATAPTDRDLVESTTVMAYGNVPSSGIDVNASEPVVTVVQSPYSTRPDASTRINRSPVIAAVDTSPVSVLM